MTNLLSTHITLPIDIIDCIIIANPKTTISTYNAIITNRKRKRNNEANCYYNNLLHYLRNNNNYYLNKSPYFKYLNNITQSIEIYNLLTKYIKKENIPVFTTNDNALSNLEATILEYSLKETNDVVIKYTQDLSKLVDIYKLNTISDLPDFIKIYLLLKSCNYFPLYSRIQSLLDNIDEIVLEWNNYLFQPEYKFIPLFDIALGMGYSFIIGYDMLIDRLIGFIHGGGCAQEYEYNKMLIEKYFKLDTKQRLIKYQKNCCQNKVSSKNKIVGKNKNKNKNNELLENIQKYLELFNTDIDNLQDFNYFNKMKINIIDN